MIKDPSIYKEIGEKLATKRKELKLSLKKVSSTLKIRVLYLQAIESGDLSKLPSGAYKIGYLKNYAKFLEEDIDSIQAETIANKEKSTDEYHSVLQSIKNAEISKPQKPALWISLALMVLISILYYSFS